MKAWTSDFSATPIPLMCCRLYGEVCYVCGSGASVASIHCSNFSVLQGQDSLYHSASCVSPSRVSLGRETSSRTGIFVFSRTLLSDAKKALRCLDLTVSVGVRSKSSTPFTTSGLSKVESDRILVSLPELRSNSTRA